MRKRELGFDVVRVVAMLGVVAIHADAITSSSTNYVGGFSWWVVAILHSAAVVSVPLFVMLSGALHLDPNKSTPTTFKQIVTKAWWRVGLPFGYWWLVLIGAQTHEPGSPWWQLAYALWTGQVGHLYFLPIMIGLYLVTPVLQQVVGRLSVRQLWWLSIGLLALASLYQHLNFLVWRRLTFGSVLEWWIPYSSYYVWGVTVRRWRLSSKQWWWAVSGFGGVCLTMAGLLYLNVQWWNEDRTFFWTSLQGNFFWEPWTLPVVVASTLGFLVLKEVPHQPWFPVSQQWLRKSITALAEASLGIYLLHYWVMQQLDRVAHLAIQEIHYSLLLYYGWRITLVVGITWVGVWLLRRTATGRLLLGEHIHLAAGRTHRLLARMST